MNMAKIEKLWNRLLGNSNFNRWNKEENITIIIYKYKWNPEKFLIIKLILILIRLWNVIK